MIRPVTTALILAAGRGRRLGAARPKQYLPLAGRPMLRWSLDTLRRHAAVDGVRVVVHPDDRDRYAAAVDGLDLPPPILGGATRQDSVRRGLEALAAAPPDLVLIHDGARPLVSAGLVDRVLAALTAAPAALPAIPVADSLRRAADGRIVGEVDRSGLVRAQTPQGFRFADILAAHREAAGDGATDDAAVARAAGLPVAVVEGEEVNFKVTTAADLARAEAALGQRQWRTRVGQGVDVHRFGPGDHVVLCGVRVPHQAALVGHSDADVALHALTDAILGAVGAGDIGSHFPPSDPQWRGADSARFLRHAVQEAAARGGRIEHLDLTVVCERPRIGPYREAMRQAVAGIVGLSVDRVSVKATTTDGLGFTGRREGIAALALATVLLPAEDAA